ncbi:hypothetical protein [Algicella marina]|uniref:Uncharacterized protein n=1 Tax=Algicella marina TaxID=2683284 RepID=A0A6P1T8T2_9RHOB|nr:hypothetical protein [Algicella marina]QHQ37032.1 hypothetical protein GO499_18510 [Algicella marina]
MSKDGDAPAGRPDSDAERKTAEAYLDLWEESQRLACTKGPVFRPAAEHK